MIIKEKKYLSDHIVDVLGWMTKKDGYMKMYLNLCLAARHTYKKKDFIFRVFVAEEKGKIVGWAIIQNLLYTIPGHVELNLYVSRESRRGGVGRRLVDFILRNVPQNIVAWAGGDTANIFFYKKYEDRIKVLDMKKYLETGEHSQYNFERVGS